MGIAGESTSTISGLKGDFCDGHHIANATVTLVSNSSMEIGGLAGDRQWGATWQRGHNERAPRVERE
jgi:hypothetical protein